MIYRLKKKFKQINQFQFRMFFRKRHFLIECKTKLNDHEWLRNGRNSVFITIEAQVVRCIFLVSRLHVYRIHIEGDSPNGCIFTKILLSMQNAGMGSFCDFITSLKSIINAGYPISF